MRRRIMRLLAFPTLLAVVGSSLLASSGAVASDLVHEQPVAALAGPCDTFPCYWLTFVLKGHGSGRVWTLDTAGNPNGLIDCQQVLGQVTASSTCSHRFIDTLFAGVQVRWTVDPEPGWVECPGLNIGCSSFGSTIMRTIEADTIFEWYFLPDFYTVSVSKTGNGSGLVTSLPLGIACGATCQMGFPFPTELTLTATPDAGAMFTGWTGACFGQDATCVLNLTADVSTNAVFAFGTPTPTPTPPASGLTLTTSAPVPPGAKDPVILWGEGFTLAVALGSGQANRSIGLQGTRDGVTWTPIQTLTTDGTGRASLFYRPVTNLYYRAIAAAAGGLPELTSNQVRTTVRQLAVMRPTNGGSTKTVARGTRVTFSTTVRPSRPELAPPTVSFYFSRQITPTVVDVIRRDVPVDDAGVARTTFDFPISGAWHVRSQANPTPYNANSLMTPIERYRVN